MYHVSRIWNDGASYQVVDGLARSLSLSLPLYLSFAVAF